MDKAPRAVWAFLLRHPVCVFSRFVGFQCQWICDFPYGRMNKRHHTILVFCCFEMFFSLLILLLNDPPTTFSLGMEMCLGPHFFIVIFLFSLHTSVFPMLQVILQVENVVFFHESITILSFTVLSPFLSMSWPPLAVDQMFLLSCPEWCVGFFLPLSGYN